MAEGRHLSKELIEACERGDTEAVQKLISSGADPSYRGWWGMTLLHTASRYVCMVCLAIVDLGHQAHALFVTIAIVYALHNEVHYIVWVKG